MNVTDRLSATVRTVRTLAEVGIIRPTRPDRLVRTARALRAWGPTPAGGYTASAARFPDETAIIDDLGSLTFLEVHERSNALAHALQDRGVTPGDGVALIARNHRGFVLAVIAISKVGANVLLLNTAFAGPQITEVCERERPAAIIYDEEFAELCSGALEGRTGLLSWAEDGPNADESLGSLAQGGDTSDLEPPAQKGKVVILTSGTTGTPKGASRKQPESLDPAAQLLEQIPLRARERTHIAAPLFHSWGYLHFTLGMSLATTLVLTRKFDAERMLETVARHRCQALIVVPVMLQRALELTPEQVQRHDTSCLRVIGASGSALPGELATRVMDRFGDVLYNLYGSTEVAWATIARPEDMRAAPGTAGKAPRGTKLAIYDERDQPVPTGTTGRIFVGNEMAFEGYTGGGGKDAIDGLLSSGDVGHLDEQGRLFVDGRDDEMIVSGGENLFPREVEDLLADHEAVEEVAMVGVDDAQFGQRLQGFVVLREGRQATEDELKQYVKERLANYKVPRGIAFLDELPRNATGKVLKRALREEEAAQPS